MFATSFQDPSFPTENEIMMTGPKFLEYVSAEPFRPFRIRMASGQMIEIRHPEMILVGRSSARVYKKIDSHPAGPTVWQAISLISTESLETIELTTTTP